MTKKVAEAAAALRAGIASNAPSGMKLVGAAALAAAGKAAQAAPAANTKAVLDAKAAKLAMLAAADDDRADKAQADDGQQDSSAQTIAMVDDGMSGGAVDGSATLIAEPQAAGGGSAPADAGKDADKGDGGHGGIGTVPLVLGGLALVGGGVAVAAGGGSKKNEPPTLAATQAVTTAEDTKTTITVSATDPNNDTLTYSNSNPSKGTLTVSGNSYTYTPNANYNGADSFTVTVSDGKGGTVTQTVNITVTPVNDPPQAPATQSVTVAEDTKVAVTVSATDVEGDSLTYSATNPANGTISQAGNVFTYSPNANFNGSDSFNVKIFDGKDSVNQTVSITVTPVNDAPVAVADTNTATEGGSKVSGSVATNDSDVEGDTLTYTLNAPVAGLAIASNGGYTFDPTDVAYDSLAAGATKAMVANYTVSDGKGGTATSTLTITVTGVNDAPVVTSAATATVDENSATSVVVYKVTGTDVDTGTTLTYGLTGTDAALFNINSSTGEVTLKNAANFEAKPSYSFNATASDGALTTVKAVTLSVNNLVDQLTINGGDAQNQVTVDARGVQGVDITDVNYRFIENVADENNVRITNFGKNDTVQFDSDLASYNFVNTGGDLVITQNSGGTVSTIVLAAAVSATATIITSADANAALNTALGTSGVAYLVGTGFASATISADQGNGTLVQLNAADSRVTFTESANTQNTVQITNFTSDDRILVSNAAPGDYSFNVVNVAGGAALDLVITNNNNGIVSSITLVDFFTSPPPVNVAIGGETAIETFVGFNFFQYA